MTDKVGKSNKNIITFGAHLRLSTQVFKYQEKKVERHLNTMKGQCAMKLALVKGHLRGSVWELIMTQVKKALMPNSNGMQLPRNFRLFMTPCEKI